MQPDEQCALQLENINISFSGVSILSNASFSLRANEIHAIVGKNGAGKSSFMKALTGVYTPVSGSITIFGNPIHIPSGGTVSHNEVAMVYQELSLVPSLTVLQNIFLAHHPYKKWGILQDKKAEELALKLLDQVSLTTVSLHQLVKELSAGEAQLVEIAKAISGSPKIIVFDEPTASLADLEIEKLFNTITHLRSQGLSIIYITHYLEDVMKICDRVTVLRDGKVISTQETMQTTVELIVKDMLGADGELQKRIKTSKSNASKSNTENPYLVLKDVCSDDIGPINLECYPGEIIGFAGLLGSGRTELFEILYGLKKVTSGTMYMDGQKVFFRSPKQAISHGIILVPEERRTQGLVLDFDIEENISLASLHRKAKKGILNMKGRKNIAEHMISSLKIKSSGRKQIVRLLSGGNQQKVVIGKCMSTHPKIFLLDDPTFGVDIHAKREIMKIIKDYAEQGNIIFYISSEFSEIASFCDRTYIVKKQRITGELSNIDLDESEILVQVQ